MLLKFILESKTNNRMDFYKPKFMKSRLIENLDVLLKMSSILATVPVGFLSCDGIGEA